ncbi:MAG: hypothetical protein K9G59_15715 [Caulobacter sp.]|nr:hypothetical protein [Caulobacter sp.]
MSSAELNGPNGPRSRGQAFDSRVPLTGLEAWEAAVSDQVHEDFLQSVVLASPGFPEAHRQAVEGALAYAHGHTAFQATVSDAGQFFLCGVALYMDASGGLTHRRLRGLMGDSGLISAGRASALLWRLRLGKFIEPLDGDAGKGLLKRFVPTRAMEDAFRERFRVDLQAITILEPAIAPVLARLDEPAVFRGLIRQMGDDLISAAVREEPRLKVYNRIAARTAGVLVMYELVTSVTGEGDFPCCGVAATSVAGLARKFGVSRSHILSLLRQMEAAGFIRFDADSGRPVILPPMREALRLCEALVFMGQIRAGHRVLVAAEVAPAG